MNVLKDQYVLFIFKIWLKKREKNNHLNYVFNMCNFPEINYFLEPEINEYIENFVFVVGKKILLP